LTAEELEMLQKQTEMTAYKKNKLEVDAQRNWDKFYGRNGSNFFKDRHWTRHEFEEIFGDIDLKVSFISNPEF
jgi:methyltransferase-like protein 6